MTPLDLENQCLETHHVCPMYKSPVEKDSRRRGRDLLSSPRIFNHISRAGTYGGTIRLLQCVRTYIQYIHTEYNLNLKEGLILFLSFPVRF